MYLRKYAAYLGCWALYGKPKVECFFRRKTKTDQTDLNLFLYAPVNVYPGDINSTSLLVISSEI